MAHGGSVPKMQVGPCGGWMCCRIFYALTRVASCLQIHQVVTTLIQKLQLERRGGFIVDVAYDQVQGSLVKAFDFVLGCHVKWAGNTMAHLAARLYPNDGHEQMLTHVFL